MRYAFKILGFGWTYLKRYRTRLAFGLICSLLYALLNGGAVWLTKAFTDDFASTVGESSVKVADDRFTVTANLSRDVPTNGVRLLLVDNSDLNTFTNNVTVRLVVSGPQTNASVTYASSTGDPAYAAVVTVSNLANTPKPALLSAFTEKARSFQKSVKAKLALWLPHFGQPIKWRQAVCLLIFLPLIVILRGAVDYLSNYCLAWVGEYAVRDIRLDVMEKLSTLSLDFFTRSSTGDILTRISADSQNLLRSLRSAAPDLIKESATAIVIFTYLLVMDWKLTGLAFIIILFCAIPIIILGRKARASTRIARATAVMQTSQLVELISGIRVIKAFNLESAEMERFRKTSQKIVRADMKGVQAKEAIGPIVEAISICGVSVLLLYIFSSVENIKNALPFALAFMFFFQSVKKLATVHIIFEQAHISVDRLMQILGEKPKVCDPPNPKPFTAFNSGISLRNLSFGYLDKQVLSDVDLEIPRGSKLGIAGESGSGKTTLVNLLFRFYDPTKGAVQVDGLDLRQISFRELRKQMALVSQDVVIFDQTVAENIATGKSGATRAEVETAARAAFAHDFIMQLPEGYDTRVGERGVTLSGGQRQRIAIARAFVRDAPILVLDEATASLDSKAEAEVQAAIDRLAEHRTVVCVAHRLSTLAAMDKIIVLSEGRIIESGGFEELLKTNGVFAGMAARQGIFTQAG